MNIYISIPHYFNHELFVSKPNTIRLCHTRREEINTSRRVRNILKPQIIFPIIITPLSQFVRGLVLPFQYSTDDLRNTGYGSGFCNPRRPAVNAIYVPIKPCGGPVNKDNRLMRCYQNAARVNICENWRPDGMQCTVHVELVA